jgi:hypothetical protein
MRRLVWIGLAFSLLISACSEKKGELKPFSKTEDPELILIDQPQLVTFSELQADPEMYQDRLIGVTGLYFRLPRIECYPQSGPGAEWALIAEDLRLDAVGYETATRLLPQDTLMTVEGLFRLYEGPIGCGKGAPPGTAWYLEVLKIIEPNPLSGPIVSGPGGIYPGSTPIPGTPVASPGPPEGTPPPASSTPGPLPPTSSPIPTGTNTFVTPSLTATVSSTESSTPEVTPTGTLTITPTPSNTPTGTLTAMPTESPSATPTIVMTPPIIVTPTDGYPSLPPTSTPDPY